MKHLILQEQTVRLWPGAVEKGPLTKAPPVSSCKFHHGFTVGDDNLLIIHLLFSLSEISLGEQYFLLLFNQGSAREAYLPQFNTQKTVIGLCLRYNFKCPNDITQCYNKCESNLETIDSDINEGVIMLVGKHSLSCGI